ncbi:hypothetical protein PC129_g14132 [Phytophthora cactorum]|uniref:Uncharacterized protein n=1 Tax=Phytophthora cactorum TaxID=29920 RepID=A0A329RLJ6_9STRA|nr:hypothetical protein Pcac1_g6706 [Phytophthora cactorum]KAG2818740.1 hypothetical protein PC112_g12476 [Phytophthora cactorum]KAG2820862.1 hypothetical protein PC111_g11274 [Phytophthora cactorum]KAG2840686.1 hypothetical protein PC113_g19200 [Phytophthora cactorum]KAG2890400.1 hypothetical protein PC114_g17482 [Phytophthora cactorum]
MRSILLLLEDQNARPTRAKHFSSYTGAALSRQPDYAVKTADANQIGVERVSAPSSSLVDNVKAAYASDADTKQLLSYASVHSDEARRKLTPHLRARAYRYREHEGLLLYRAVDDDANRIVVPNDYDLRM